MSRKVHEFDALWTTQITQKRKKWNDGRLKFHYFNKRAILYDENDVYVADMFHNKPHLAIDDELRFDRILVTITGDRGLLEINDTPATATVNPITSRKRVPLAPRREIPNTGIPLSQIISQSSRKLTVRNKPTCDSNIQSLIPGRNVLTKGQSAPKTNSIMQLELELSQTLDILQEPYISCNNPEVITAGIEESDDDVDISVSTVKTSNHVTPSEYGPWSSEAYDLFDMSQPSI